VDQVHFGPFPLGDMVAWVCWVGRGKIDAGCR
jgi:hypothetical protein